MLFINCGYFGVLPCTQIKTIFPSKFLGIQHVHIFQVPILSVQAISYQTIGSGNTGQLAVSFSTDLSIRLLPALWNIHAGWLASPHRQRSGERHKAAYSSRNPTPDYWHSKPHLLSQFRLSFHPCPRMESRRKFGGPGVPKVPWLWHTRCLTYTPQLPPPPFNAVTFSATRALTTYKISVPPPWLFEPAQKPLQKQHTSELLCSFIPSL